MSGSYGSEDEPTRRIPLEPRAYDPGPDPRAQRRGEPSERDSWRDDGSAAPPPGSTRPPRRRGRDVGMWLFGVVIGFVVAFIVVALGTNERPAGDADADRQIDALEAELEDRDAQIADLEARLAEAEAAAGDRAEDIQAQRDALDERASVLDQRAGALDEREAALDTREAQLDERERAIEEAPDEPGIDLPDVDDSFIDQVLDQLRDLFGG